MLGQSNVSRETRSALCLALAITFLALLSGCDFLEKAEQIDANDILEPAFQNAEAPKPEGTLSLAIGSMITPSASYLHYNDLIRFVEKNLGRPIMINDQKSYSEVNESLKNKTTDIALVCSLPYVDGHDDFGLELLVVPQVKGRTEYYSYIIVPATSPYQSLEDLRKKTFAFTDPLSNSGKLYPEYLMMKKNETSDSFFLSYIYTYAHDRSIRLVAEGAVDGAAVDSLIWDYLNNTDPTYTSKTRIIHTSAAFGIPPVVTRPDLDPKTKEDLRKIFMTIHYDETGRQILDTLGIDKFVPISDDAYDSIRKIRKQLPVDKKAS